MKQVPWRDASMSSTSVMYRDEKSHKEEQINSSSAPANKRQIIYENYVPKSFQLCRVPIRREKTARVKTFQVETGDSSAARYIS